MPAYSEAILEKRGDDHYVVLRCSANIYPYGYPTWDPKFKPYYAAKEGEAQLEDRDGRPLSYHAAGELRVGQVYDLKICQSGPDE